MADKKKLKVWLPLLLSLCMIAGMFVGYRIRGNMPDRGIFFVERTRPVQEVLDLINKKYVDSVNIDSLGDVAIQAVLGGLDPHSVFIPASRMQEVNEDLEGVFFGIGVEFSIINDTANTMRVLQGGPSERAGMKPGDKFIKVNGVLVAGNHITNDKLKEIMRGKSGTKVDAEILRNGKLINKQIIRGPVRLFSIDASYMLNDSIGFIRISRFSETTYKEFMIAMDSLHKKGMRALVLDLRDNGGGILTEATHIADEFLSGNKLITYTEGAHSPKKEYRCDKDGVFEKGSLVVLINEGTASASEVLAGALQDWGRAKIVGRRSFGKGLVQEQYELGDGSGLRLTVARYFTPLGRSIQRSYKAGNEAYYHDIIDRFKSGEMLHGDSINHAGEKKYITAAGNVLYGGDGITPDVFVPIDSMQLGKPVMRALLKGTLDQFVYFNYLNNQHTISQFQNPQIFNKDFVVGNPELENFKSFAQKDSIHVNLGDANERHQISQQIKMLTARLVWGTGGFFEVKNATDSTIRKSLEIIEK
ncbi:MAG: S41 family peptidase [Chitinophagaceae bacterium]|nr:S41 family peptidase [Chitinophagaceae bacterium]